MLQPKPVPEVHCNALVAPLQLGIETAVGDAVEAVALPRMLFAACVARSAVVTNPVAVKAPVTIGLAIVGDVARTGLPEPVTAFAKPAATPAPSPDTPVETGNPVPFVRTTEDGVPRTGVTRVGEFDSTTEPDPVELEAPVPPFAAVSGFCSVRELNVGDGKVCPNAATEISPEAKTASIFFIFPGNKKAAKRRLVLETFGGSQEMETTPALFHKTPAVAGSVVGRWAAHAVDPASRGIRSESGIVHLASWPFCV